MASYAQWSKSKAAPSRVTWVCGPEPVLATEVAEAIVSRASPELCIRVHAGDTPEAELWDQVCAYPDGSRLVLVHGARELSLWHRLEDAAEAARAGGWVVLLSDDPDIYARRVRPGDDRALTPGAAAVRAAGGQVVRCVLAEGNHSERIAWVTRRFPGATEAQAWEILVRCGQRISAVASVCDQAVLSGYPASWAVKNLLEDLPGEEVADSLVLNDRAGALRAAAELDPAEYGAVIGQLAGRLDLMVSLHEAVQQKMGSRDAKARLGVEPFLYAKLRTVAPDYSPDRVAARRSLLARIDAAYMSGAREGIPEALVACW